MGKFPNDVTEYKPIPRIAYLEQCDGFKKPNTQGDYAQGNKPPHNSVEEVYQKNDFIDFGLGFFVNQT